MTAEDRVRIRSGRWVCRCLTRPDGAARAGLLANGGLSVRRCLVGSRGQTGKHVFEILIRLDSMLPAVGDQGVDDRVALPRLSRPEKLGHRDFSKRTMLGRETTP